MEVMQQVTKDDNFCMLSNDQAAPVKETLRELLLLRKALMGVCEGRLNAEAMAQAVAFDHKLAKKKTAACKKLLGKLS